MSFPDTHKYVKNPVPNDPFEESVYALIPQLVIPPPQKERYRSNFADQARQEYVKGRKNTASMGPAKVIVNHPTRFLKKGEGEQLKPASKLI
jgi:hypothetical protein